MMVIYRESSIIVARLVQYVFNFGRHVEKPIKNTSVANHNANDNKGDGNGRREEDKTNGRYRTLATSKR